MKPGILLGLTGYATAGKDELADVLVRDYDYIKLGFADPLYRMALILNPEVEMQDRFLRWMRKRTVRLRDIVDKVGWTEAKKIQAIREFLQILGTEVCRENLGEDVFVNAMRPKIAAAISEGTNVVVTNCRFANEGHCIKDLGGDIVLIERPGTGPVNDHKSDAGECFAFASQTLVNDGDLKSWARKACVLHNSLSFACGHKHESPIDASAAISHLEGVVDRAIRGGISLALDIARPASTTASEWRKAHKLTAQVSRIANEGAEFKVHVDGQTVGLISYSNGTLSVEAYLGK